MSPATECTGKFSGALCGIPNPEWRHHFRVGWETPWNVDVSLTWRYYDGVTNIANGTAANIDYELGEQNYFDLVANWAVTEKSSVILGINNVLDDDPPITSAVGTTGNGNTFPQTYDALGRWIFVRGIGVVLITILSFEQTGGGLAGAAAFLLCSARREAFGARYLLGKRRQDCLDLGAVAAPLVGVGRRHRVLRQAQRNFGLIPVESGGRVQPAHLALSGSATSAS